MGSNTAPVILAPICYRNGGCILLKHLLLRITIIDFYCSSYNYDNGRENTTVMLTNIHSISITSKQCLMRPNYLAPSEIKQEFGGQLLIVD